MSEEDRYFICTEDNTNVKPNITGFVYDGNNPNERLLFTVERLKFRPLNKEEAEKYELMESLK